MKKKQFQACNILALQEGERHLWQFGTDNGEISLDAEQRASAVDRLPPRIAGRTWRTFWQPKLNVAWLPADQVFLRIVQLPATEPGEVLAMLDFQMEKISPMPVPQIVWSVELMPKSQPNVQTAIVVIAPRSLVESYLGKLEQQGYQADLLEFPQLHQVAGQVDRSDGAWIYPGSGAEENLYMAAWWHAGELRDLQLVLLPPGENRARLLEEQLLQMAWAGEMEGWVQFPVAWHFVATGEAAERWKPLLAPWAGDQLHFHPPISEGELAALSAHHATHDEGHPQANLLPAEFAVRYRQQFIDRLWMGGLGALLVIYILGVAGYFAALTTLKVQENNVQSELTFLGRSYTNALQLKEQVGVLQDQLNLKYAALDSWKAASESLPPELTLNRLIFGRTLELHGVAPQEQAGKVNDYNDALRNFTVDEKPLFKSVSLPSTAVRQGGGAPQVSWSFNCDLNNPFD